MTRTSSTAVLIVLAMLLLGLPAVAQDTTKPDKIAPEKTAPVKTAPDKTEGPARAGARAAPDFLDPAKGPEFEIAPVTGEKVEIQVRPGVVLKGIVKDHRCEVLTPEGFYTPVESDEVRGAGVRVYHAMGLDGFIFLRYDTISEINFRGKLSQEEGMALARRILEEMKRAEAEKKRAVADMEARRARLAAEKAAREKEVEEAAVQEGAIIESERATEIKALLERFPPPEWRPARLGELKKRALILDIYPNDEESAFIDNYELWFEGYEIWRRAQEELGKQIEPPADK